MTGPGPLDLVTADPVLGQLREQLRQGPLADPAQAFGRELVAPVPVVDEAGLLQHLRQLGQLLEALGRIVAEEFAGPVEIGFGQLGRGGGRSQQVLELVEVAQALQQARGAGQVQRVGAREVVAPVPAQVGKGALEVAGQVVHLPGEVEVAEELLGECLELAALLLRHRRQQRLHLRHRAGHLLQQLVEALWVAGEELAVALHKPSEVGLLPRFPGGQHGVELGQHVLERLHPLGRHVGHALGHPVELALEELLAQLVAQLLEAAAGLVVGEVVLRQLPEPAGQVG